MRNLKLKAKAVSGTSRAGFVRAEGGVDWDMIVKVGAITIPSIGFLLYAMKNPDNNPLANAKGKSILSFTEVYGPGGKVEATTDCLVKKAIETADGFTTLCEENRTALAIGCRSKIQDACQSPDQKCANEGLCPKHDGYKFIRQLAEDSFEGDRMELSLAWREFQLAVAAAAVNGYKIRNIWRKDRRTDPKFKLPYELIFNTYLQILTHKSRLGVRSEKDDTAIINDLRWWAATFFKAVFVQGTVEITRSRFFTDALTPMEELEGDFLVAGSFNSNALPGSEAASYWSAAWKLARRRVIEANLLLDIDARETAHASSPRRGGNTSEIKVLKEMLRRLGSDIPEVALDQGEENVVNDLIVGLV